MIELFLTVLAFVYMFVYTMSLMLAYRLYHTQVRYQVYCDNWLDVLAKWTHVGAILAVIWTGTYLFT